jgi:hypothetical protein
MVIFDSSSFIYSYKIVFNELFIAFDGVNIGVSGNCGGIKMSELGERNVLIKKTPQQTLKMKTK